MSGVNESAVVVGGAAVVPPGPGLRYCVVVMACDGRQYRRVAQWEVGESPRLVVDLSPDEGLGRALVSRLHKHLHRLPEPGAGDSVKGVTS